MLAYRKLVKAAQVTIQQANKSCQPCKPALPKQPKNWLKTLETFLPRAEQVVDQTIRRVFQQEKVPASQKIVSLFEPHTDIIRRNKAHKPTEYGTKVWLDEVEGGLVTRWKVLEVIPTTTSSGLSVWNTTTSSSATRPIKPAAIAAFIHLAMNVSLKSRVSSE